MCTFVIALKGAGLSPDEARAGWQQDTIPDAFTVMETEQRTAWSTPGMPLPGEEGTSLLCCPPQLLER